MLQNVNMLEKARPKGVQTWDRLNKSLSGSVDTIDLGASETSLQGRDLVKINNFPGTEHFTLSFEIMARLRVPWGRVA